MSMLERVVAAAPELDVARRALVYVYLRTGRKEPAAALAARDSATRPSKSLAFAARGWPDGLQEKLDALVKVPPATIVRSPEKG